MTEPDRVLPINAKKTRCEHEGVWAMAKAAEPKKQHYVPRFYLRGFTGKKGKLFAVNRPTGHAFRPPPKA